MRYKGFRILLVLLLTSAAFAGAYLDYFQARSEGENVKLEWKTGDETNIHHFSIERRTHQTSFAEITQIQPKGSNSYYTFTDQSVYKSNSVIFTYRLKIVDNNNQATYSSEAAVSPNISGVKRTWGSIKAMFR